MIEDLLRSGRPAMVGRFGCTEMSCLHNYLEIGKAGRNPLDYITGRRDQWWWNKNIMRQMREWSGFFPAAPEYLARFCELMLRDMMELDILGSWLPYEREVMPMIRDVPRVRLLNLEPYWSSRPWSRALEGRKVLVVHPFAESITRQYERNRERIFENPEVLPSFSLETLAAVQSLGAGPDRFADWFEALAWMEGRWTAGITMCASSGAGLTAFIWRPMPRGGAGRPCISAGLSNCCSACGAGAGKTRPTGPIPALPNMIIPGFSMTRGRGREERRR
ncbi:hypothetical protein ABFY27_07580 [Akkermansia massiliensis]